MIYLKTDKGEACKLVPNKEKMFKFKVDELSKLPKDSQVLVAETNIYPFDDEENLINATSNLQIENINFNNGVEFHTLTPSANFQNDFYIINSYCNSLVRFGKLLKIRGYYDPQYSIDEDPLYKWITFNETYLKDKNNPGIYKLKNIINLTEKLFYLENLLSLGRKEKNLKNILLPDGEDLLELLNLFELVKIDYADYTKFHSFHVERKVTDKILALKKPSN